MIGQRWSISGSLSSTQAMSYFYNGLGVRYRQVGNVNGTLIQADTVNDMLGSLPQVLQETTSYPDQNIPSTDIRYMVAGSMVLGQDVGGDNGQWSYNTYDALGSLRQVVGPKQTKGLGFNRIQISYPVLYSADYDPFGNPFDQRGNLQPIQGYTGAQTDDTGLLYLNARYYDPTTATFLSRDPFGGVADRAASRNGYDYVEGNPANGAVGELGWHNPYAYANGNPTNGAVGELSLPTRQQPDPSI